MRRGVRGLYGREQFVEISLKLRHLNLVLLLELLLSRVRSSVSETTLIPPQSEMCIISRSHLLYRERAACLF